MDVRNAGTEQLVPASARLLAAASVLTTVGLGLTTWTGWQQIGQSYGPDGTPTMGNVDFPDRVSIAIFQSSFGAGGLQLSLAAVLLVGAVLALHLHPRRSRLRTLRWEVLAAGVVTLVPTVLIVLANLYVLTSPADGGGDGSEFVGPQPMTEVALNNLTTLMAALLTLTVAALWWLRLGKAPDEGGDADPGDVEAGDDEDEVDGAPVEDETAPVALAVAQRAPHPRGPADATSVETHRDYSRDWSPEDFLPPR